MKAIEHPDFAVPVIYDAMPLPEDSGDAQVASTIDVMRRIARDDSRSVPEQELAASLLAQCSTPEDYVQAVFKEANRRMYFQNDERTAEPIGQAVELLIRPAYVIEMFDATGNKVPGDCDCFSMFVASMLMAAGVDCAFATCSTMRDEPDTFSHVYVIAWPQTSRRVAVDASHGPRIGWEAPNYGRYQEWPLSGGTSSCAELLLMGLIFVAGIFFEWGDRRGNGQRVLEAA